MEFIGTCVGLEEKDLNDFDDSSHDISYRTFVRYLGRREIRDLNKSFGVPLSRDWHVSFKKGKWRGKKAICLFHSAIHHIWTV